jgi:translation initiation factor IF-3
MPAFFGSLVVIPIILIGRAFEKTEIGFFAAVFASITYSYYNRTMAGYYDSDMFALIMPPVCRIDDYQKFLYQQKKKAKELKANQTKVVVKEIRFGPQTDDHDYNFKLKHAQNFLKEGAKVKAYVFFRGRSIVFKEQGEILLLRFATDLEEFAKVEAMPRLDGKKMNMMLAPKSKK